MMTSSISFLLFVTLPWIPVIKAQGPQREGAGWKPLPPHDKLTATLLSSYNNHNPPSHNQSTRVDIALVIQSITKLDEFEGSFSAVAWQKLLWRDSRLTWNVSDYDGINVVRIPAWQIWKPNIILFNSVSERKALLDVDTMVYSDGTLYHVVPINIQSSCRMKLDKYPYDAQNCTLIWGAWMQDNSVITLTTSDNKLDLEDFTPNPIWEIVHSSIAKNTKKYDCCPETYEDIRVSVVLRRRHPDSLIASAVIATWMILIAFVIAPPSSGERIIFSSFIFVSLIIQSAWLSSSVPAYTSTNLGRYLVFGMLITALITVFLAGCRWFYQRQGLDKGNESLDIDLLHDRRRRLFRLIDLGAVSVIVMLLSIMTGALFA